MNIQERNKLFNTFQEVIDTFGNFQECTELESFIKCALFAQYHRLTGDEPGMISWNESMSRNLAAVIRKMALESNFGFKIESKVSDE